MYGFHTKINQNGRIIIPARFRKELGLKEGDGVIISKTADGDIKISTAKQSLEKLQEMVASKKLNVSFTEQLFEIRKNEIL